MPFVGQWWAEWATWIWFSSFVIFTNEGIYMPRGIHQKQDGTHSTLVPVLSLARLLARQVAAELVAADKPAFPSSPNDYATEDADAEPQN